MARGPKPAPKVLKELKGTQKCRINHDEPEPIPPPSAEPPTELDEEARAEWDRLHPTLSAMKVLSASDLSALALYCSTWSLWREAEDELRMKGLMVKTPFGIQVNPLVNVVTKARAQCLRFLAEFGCTPSSRTRVKAEGGKPRDEFTVFMAEGG